MANTSTRRDFLKGGSSAAVLAAAGCPSYTPTEIATKPPNFLFLFPDQHRFDWISAYPNIPVRTPNLEKLAARGVRFTNAVCASPLCAPSRACLAAGKEYDHCGVRGNFDNYPLEQTTYYTLLRDAGYHVTGCGKLDLHKATEFWGLDGKRLLPEWGFSDGVDNAGKWDALRSGSETPKDPYMGHLHQVNLAKTHVDDFTRRREVGTFLATFPTPLPDASYCDNWIAQNGLDLLRAAPEDKPWHLVVNFAGPHEPVDITESMDPWYRDADFPQPNRNTQHPAEKHAEIRRNYSAMIENIDRWVGVYLDELEKRGELDNTVIVYSSDHGEMLGDQDRWMKRFPFQASAGVPLIVAGPGARQGQVSDALVSVMDIAATFLDYAAVPVPADMDSRSLRPLLEGETGSHREFVLSGLDPWRMVFDGRYKLIRGFDLAELRVPNAGARTPMFKDTKDMPPVLFDLQDDPLENENVAARAANEVDRLSEILEPA